MRALDHAIATARPGATLHLLNVELPLDDYGMVPAYLSASRHRQWTARRGQDLLAPALARAKRSRIPCHAHLVWGEIAPSIVRTASRLGCGAIVMGTRGRGAIGNLVLGSIATKVVHLAKVPVTLVK